MDNCGDDLKFLDERFAQEEKTKPQADRSRNDIVRKLNFVLENNFKRVSYTEAIDILKDSTPNKKKKFQYLIEEWELIYNRNMNAFSRKTLQMPGYFI